MRAVRKGDMALVYHTGDEKQVVGIAEITSDPYPDPAAGDPKLVVFDLKAKRALARPVTLASIKADARSKDFALVKISRLSVMPVSPTQWSAILELGE